MMISSQVCYLAAWMAMAAAQGAGVETPTAAPIMAAQSGAGRQPAPSIYDRPAPIKTAPADGGAQGEGSGDGASDKGFLPLRGEKEEETSADIFGEWPDRPYSQFDWIEVKIAFWNTGFDANVKSSQGALSGTDINLAEQLGFANNQGVFLAGLSLQLSDHIRLWLDHFYVNYQSTSILSEELVFKGIVYKANTKVDSALELDSLRAGFDFELIKGRYGSFGLGIAGNYVSNATSITAFNLVTTSAEIKVVVPMVTMSGRLAPIPMLGLGLDGAWIGFDKSNLYDMSLYAEVNLIRYVGISMGWKAVILDVNSGGDSVYLRWSGLYAALAARF